MDRFQEMQVFLRIAERSSFSLAADDLMIPRATVSNLLKRLEQRLGVRLLERTTRQVRVTHEGQAYYHRCVRILNDLEEADSAFTATQPKGMLRINLQGTLAKHFVVPNLAEFVDKYPGIQLQIGEGDRLIDLVEEGVDCVLRAGPLQDSQLIARQLALMEQVTVASPGYLKRYGTPETLEQLAGHKAVDYLSSAVGHTSTLDFQVKRKQIEVPLSSIVSVNSADLYTGAALAGLGIIQVPRYRIIDELEAGQLTVVLSHVPPPPMPVSVVYTQHRQLSARVRVFTQWLAAQFEHAQNH